MAERLPYSAWRCVIICTIRRDDLPKIRALSGRWFGKRNWNQFVHYGIHIVCRCDNVIIWIKQQECPIRKYQNLSIIDKVNYVHVRALAVQCFCINRYVSSKSHLLGKNKSSFFYYVVCWVSQHFLYGFFWALDLSKTDNRQSFADRF